MRAHPRSIEAVIKALKKIVEAPDTSVAECLRASELILAAHGRLTLPPERLPRRNGLKGLVNAQLDLSETDKTIVAKVRRGTDKSQQRRINKILKDENWKQ